MDRGTQGGRRRCRRGPLAHRGRDREAYHATKAALAGLRPRGTRSARDRNGYDWTARITYVTALEKRNLEVPRPRHPLSQVAGFLMGDIAWATLSIRNARTAGSVAQPAPDRPFSNDNGAGTPPQLSPSGGVFPVGGPACSLTMRIACPNPRRARLRWLHSPRVGGGNDYGQAQSSNDLRPEGRRQLPC